MTGWDHQELDPASPADYPTRRELHRARRGKEPRRRWPFVVAGLLVVVLVGALLAFRNLEDNIDKIDLAQSLGTDRPTAEVEGPLNILVMGSDDRQGIGTTEYGTDTVEGGAHSDTNMLVHLSADRERALVVSIPRDSMVRAPQDCSDLDTPISEGVIRQWNLNFNQGGAPCVIRTLEGNTDIRVDHFVIVDFRGFQEMVDALGGVEVCVAEDIDDPDARIQLAAGRQVLDGREALGYVRMRKTLGDGSDLGRIERQQAFMSSVAQKATSTSLLLRPDRLYSFLDAATESITTDSELGTTELARIANSLRSIGLSNVEFVTVPTEVFPEDPNRVQWTSDADLLWEAIRQDRPLNAPSDEPVEAASTPAAPTTPLTVSPDQISVLVQNASSVGGLAGQATAALAVQGFVALPGGNLPGAQIEGTVIRHTSALAEAARTVQAAFPGSQLVLDEAAGSSVVVQMGPGAANPVEVPNRLGVEPLPTMTVSAEHLGSSASSTATIPVRTADTDICS